MRLYDTYTRGLVELPPPPGPIGMYFCGPTVYQRIHVGNAIPFVLPLWLKRWLELAGYETKLVANVTDINDKIYDAAPGESARLAADATRWYIDDTDRLGLGRPDVEPTAVETVPDQIHMIEQLIEAGYAYVSDGDVYYRVARFAEYGRLSGQRPDQVEEQEPNPRKEDPRDFALWKANKPGEDTWWDSPWGRGRPGWHIECSVMAEKHLGSEFEIHGGGLDLVFPHHENELAQSRALGHGFAHIWAHNGLLRFGGEKMSKSVGNVVSLADALDRWGRETLLVFFLSGHWRKPLDYTDETMTAAAARTEGLRDVFRSPAVEAREGWERFAEALEDDFNTPEALAVMHEWRDHELLLRALDVFGLAFSRGRWAPPGRRRLAELRAGARAEKDWGRRTGSGARSRRGLGGSRRRRSPVLPARAPHVTRELVYGRNAVREAVRGRREVLELWASERAVGRCRGLRKGLAFRRSKERELTEATGSPITRGSWPGRGRSPMRTAGACGRAAAARVPRPGDRSTQPRGGGRSALGAGATGVIVPAHGSARVTPAVCRSSAGAVEHLPVAASPTSPGFSQR